MTVQRIKGVGFCASTDAVGDRALAVALECARRHRVRLDIFFFPSSPYEPHATRGRHGESGTLPRAAAIELERHIRLYYDERLGDYLDVGFRLCEGDEDPELRRCLLFRKEYDVLVLPYPAPGCRFGRSSLVEFAQTMPCPVILVGPEEMGELWVNTAAHLLISAVLPPGQAWRELEPLELVQPVG